MGPARDDGVVDPQPHPETGEVDSGSSFDPGLETGYLRRAPRDHELDPELGAAPFDPGPGHYDARRARKQGRRRQQVDRQRTELSTNPEPEPEPIAQPEPPVAAAPPVRSESPAPIAEPPREAEVIELPRREPLGERLERERVERERAEREHREKVERERAARERAERDATERRRREREEKLRRDREALRPARQAAPVRAAPAKATPAKTASARRSARIDPAVRGPVTRRRGLFWPTAKAGLAITVALAVGAGLGSLLGLPVPGLDQSSGTGTLVNSASLFGIDPGTPTGLVRGYVFPLLGPHDFGDKIARFGAPRSGHIHEGQDIFGKTGTPEVAVHDGIVVDRGRTSDPDDGGRGNYIAIYSPPDNHSFVYMHMLKPSPVTLGDHVHSGEVVGQLGCTGSCDGPHLHFEVRIGKATLGADTKPIDPLPFLKQWPQSQG